MKPDWGCCSQLVVIFWIIFFFLRFYLGRRTEDDERQISRWKKCAGVKGRWRNNLIGKCVRSGCSFDNNAISPVVRQTLQHWGYRLSKADFEKGAKRVKWQSPESVLINDRPAVSQSSRHGRKLFPAPHKAPHKTVDNLWLNWCGGRKLLFEGRKSCTAKCTLYTFYSPPQIKTCNLGLTTPCDLFSSSYACSNITGKMNLQERMFEGKKIIFLFYYW